MNKGFVPLLVVAIIGVVTLVAGGGAYGVYKYNQVVEEKQILTEKIDEQKDVEIQKLQEQVDSLKEGDVSNTEEDSEVMEEKLTTYYIKSEVANVRPCTDVKDPACGPVGQIRQNTEVELPYLNIDDMPEWLPTKWAGDNAYINKLVLSDNLVLNTPTSAIAPVLVKTETDQSRIDAGVQDVLAQQNQAILKSFVTQLTSIYNDFKQKGSANFIEALKYASNRDYDRAITYMELTVASCGSTQKEAKNLRVFFTTLPDNYVDASVHMEKAAYHLCQAGVQYALEDNEMVISNAEDVDKYLDLVYSFLISV